MIELRIAEQIISKEQKCVKQYFMCDFYMIWIVCWKFFSQKLLKNWLKISRIIVNHLKTFKNDRIRIAEQISLKQSMFKKILCVLCDFYVFYGYFMKFSVKSYWKNWLKMRNCSKSSQNFKNVKLE